MSRVSVVRKLPHRQKALMDVLLDVASFPSFVPGVARVKTQDAPVDKGSFRAEAFLRSNKFSGTVRLQIEVDRDAGLVRVRPDFGPFKALSATVRMSELSARETEVRCDVQVMASILALNSLFERHLNKMVTAYVEVFSDEAQRRERFAVPTA